MPRQHAAPQDALDGLGPVEPTAAQGVKSTITPRAKSQSIRSGV